MRNCGSLRELIEIYASDTTRNEYGESVQNYQKVYECRAAVQDESGQQQNINNEIVTTYTKTFQVRHYVPCKEQYVIFYKGNRYLVKSIDDRTAYMDKLLKTEMIID